jgi:hypothetical protein
MHESEARRLTMNSAATSTAAVRTLTTPQQHVVRSGIISSCTLQHNQIFLERLFQIILYLLFYHTTPQNLRNCKRRRLNYKQNQLWHSLKKSRCSPANVIFLIRNLLYRRTHTSALAQRFRANEANACKAN